MTDIIRVNNCLVAALELLDNKKLKGEALMREVYRARRIYELALQIIENAAVRFGAHNGFKNSLTGKLLKALKILVAKREGEIINRWQTR
jgi:hypothetical protein